MVDRLVTLGTTSECWCGEDIEFVQDPVDETSGIWLHSGRLESRCYPEADDNGHAEPIPSHLTWSEARKKASDG